MPADNVMTNAKVELGRHLFYDKRMSSNGKESCATCHRQDLAFTDGLPVSKGTTGQLHSRGAMSLVNVAYSAVLTWGDPSMTKLEDQALVPMFGTKPVELGLTEGKGLWNWMAKDHQYIQLFRRAYPASSWPYHTGNIAKAIACFERTIISARSPYDRYHYGGDDNAVTAAAKHGEELFFNEHLHCFQCHGGFDFTDATASARTGPHSVEFHNNGLYLTYSAPNRGVYEHTRLISDIGKFKAPTLRNIAITGPYMHDGSIRTLGEVLDHYAAGGRTISNGPNAGNGSKNPNKDPRVGGFKLTPQDKADVLTFLETLTDREVLHDPRFADPWPK